MAILAAGMSVAAYADEFDNDREYWYRSGDTPEVEVWTNKGNGARYYFGEDVAVFFRAEQDCYVVVYDIDPSGEVNILFPSSLNGSSSVEGGRVYRVPDYNDDFRLEVAGNSGNEHIFAVASYDYINPPDYMKYVGYDYGEDSYYDDDYFAIHVRGDLNNFVARLNARICNGPYVVAHTKFIADSNYRHHRQYRYWGYDPYYVSSIWIGSDYPGSEIWIDGVFIGIAPILVPRVVVGYHWIWAYYGGYPCYQRYFYVPSYQRYYIDVRVDSRYHDYKFRRRAFRDWVFEEKKYRNEDNFRERAIDARRKSVRTRSLPTSVVRDYADRGVISKEAPIVKKVRTNDVDRDRRSIDDSRSLKPENPRASDRDDKGSRTRSIEPREDKRERRSGGEQIDRWDGSNEPKGESRMVVPERKSETERVRPSDDKRNSDRNSSENSWQKRENRNDSERQGSEVREQKTNRKDRSEDKKIEPRNEAKRNTGDVKKQENTKEESSKKESSRNTEKKENRTSGKKSTSDRSRERSR
jgi:hypothetical protein